MFILTLLVPQEFAGLQGFLQIEQQLEMHKYL